jgi:hypothetical protein
MKHSEDQDPNWDLLKKAAKTEPAANFTQNVMREIRLLDSAPGSSRFGWFSLRWAGCIAAAAAVIVICLVMLNPADQAPPLVDGDVDSHLAPVPVVYEEEITIEEFADELAELAYLSDLMEVPDTSLLADEELAALLF